MVNNERLLKLTNILSEEGVDGCILGPTEDIEYIAGIKLFKDERFAGFFLFSDGSWFFISPELYYEEFRNKLGEKAHIYVWSDNEGVNKAFKEAAKEYALEGKNIAVNAGIRAVDLIDMKQIMKSNFVNGDKMLEQFRIIKDEEEKECLAKAAEIADRTFEEIIKFIKPGITERAISDKIKELLMELGGEELSFETIVASGPNSSMPHYNDDKRVIEEQDLVILDYGCRYKGYCSDISRTVFIGEPTEEQKKIYEIVLRANTEAEKVVKEGVKAEDIDKTARKIIADEGYGRYFINRTGHGIGLADHEAPYIKDGNEEVLKTGMSFSVEPGIYIPGKFGMRVEDIVMVDGEGPIIFNKANKDMVIV